VDCPPLKSLDTVSLTRLVTVPARFVSGARRNTSEAASSSYGSFAFGSRLSTGKWS